MTAPTSRWCSGSASLSVFVTQLKIELALSGKVCKMRATSSGASERIRQDN
jgi:hypothetical protein